MSQRILVVDDDEDISLMLSDRLTYLGFQTTIASNGANGLELMEKTVVDGILLDIQMPVMDGLTMLQRLRSLHPSMPVIVMTAEQNEAKLNEAIKNGATDYILKPIDLDVLARKCRSVFLLN